MHRERLDRELAEQDFNHDLAQPIDNHVRVGGERRKCGVDSKAIPSISMTVEFAPPSSRFDAWPNI